MCCHTFFSHFFTHINIFAAHASIFSSPLHIITLLTFFCFNLTFVSRLLTYIVYLCCCFCLQCLARAAMNVCAWVFESSTVDFLCLFCAAIGCILVILDHLTATHRMCHYLILWWSVIRTNHHTSTSTDTITAETIVRRENYFIRRQRADLSFFLFLSFCFVDSISFLFIWFLCCTLNCESCVLPLRFVVIAAAANAVVVVVDERSMIPDKWSWNVTWSG